MKRTTNVTNASNFIPHPRQGPTYRVALDYALIMVVGALVRQSTSQTEAILAIRGALDRLIRESGRGALLQDDPVDIPHLAASVLRLHTELVCTGARLELAYRYLQRARETFAQADASDRDTDPGGILRPIEDA